MHWVLQENLYNESQFESFVNNLEKFEQTYDIVKVIPFVGETLPRIEAEGEVICFGAYFMREYAITRGWNPGVYDMEFFPYTSLVDKLGKEVLNHDCVVDKFKNINPDIEEFFMRPVADGKEFAGCIMKKEELSEWQKRVIDLGLADNGSTVTGDTEVMYSSLKTIYEERRFFIIGKKAVTGSLYKRGSRIYYTETDINLDVAQQFAEKLEINSPYVMDIALTDSGHKVIELNTLNCAGFYAADMQKLIVSILDYEK